MKVLISYHYYAKVDLDRELGTFATKPAAVFGDSGAFSAFTQGAVINPDDYAAWVKRWSPKWLTWYSNLDVIGSPEGTWRNQIILEKRHGLAPLPVFHVGEPWVFLDKYLDRGYPYLCLGGMVGKPTPLVKRWAAQCFKRARDGGYDVVFHGFGQTKRAIADALPWYSIDSSSWGSGHRFGQGMLWDHQTARFLKVSVGDRQLHKYGRLIREHFTDPKLLSDREQYHHSHIARMSAVAWLRYEAWLQRRYQVPFPHRTGDEGPGMYLVVGPPRSPLAHADIPAEGPGVYLVAGAVGGNVAAMEEGRLPTSDMSRLAYTSNTLDEVPAAGPGVFFALPGGQTSPGLKAITPTEDGRAHAPEDGPGVYLAEGSIHLLREAAEGAAQCE